MNTNNPEEELTKMLSEELAKSIDKEILKNIMGMGFSKEMIDKTRSNIKQTIREGRLGKILNKNND
ncbi:MAG: hypothetical protein SLAVMIC_00892 [uncultured marine phage]|uniref:Uncharacterized protein n=1 Tax=uncultured marine phage TaxID=707152 RepID=A0A8D9CDU1_9VIRU|nr:MAG: hypothetical protein SLAVMIC_00892 [uncultured marine phage]